jgi:hypothetical protein
MSARRKPARLPLDFDPGYARLRVLEHLSEEQRLQITRLEHALTAEGKPCDHGETIAALAAAALWVLGLDPVSRDSFERFSDVVLKDEGVDGSIWEEMSNGPWGVAERWTKAQRVAEREAALKGRAA